MAYIVIKTIKGKAYRYLQRSWREGKRVRTQSKCLGAAGSSGRYNSAFDRQLQESLENLAMATVQRDEDKFEQWQRETYGETARERIAREQQEKLDSLHEAFGLRMPEEGK